MNILKRLLLVLALLCPILSASAETPFAQQLRLLGEQRDKEAALAMEPVNRHYSAGLEQLLRHATQGNDLETALKVKETLATLAVLAEKKLEPGSAMLLGTWQYHAPNVNSTMREFHADGTFAITAGGPTRGTWKIEDNKLILTYPDGKDTFPLPLRTSKMVGRTSSATDVTMSKER